MTLAGLIHATAATTHGELQALRRELIARMADLVHHDPTVADAGTAGPGRFEPAHLRRLLGIVDVALGRWAGAFQHQLETALPGAARLGVEAVDTDLVRAIRRARRGRAVTEALSPEDQRLLAELGLDVAPVEAEVTHRILRLFIPELVQGLLLDTRMSLGRILRAGILGGVGPFQLMREVTQLLMGVGQEDLGPLTGRVTTSVAFRAETIVRTELARVFETATDARRSEYAKTVEGLEKEWHAHPDDPRTRPAHAAAHGQRVQVTEPFRVGGEALRYPLDPHGSPGNTINCRCRSLTVVTPAAIDALAKAVA